MGAWISTRCVTGSKTRPQLKYCSALQPMVTCAFRSVCAQPFSAATSRQRFLRRLFANIRSESGQVLHYEVAPTNQDLRATGYTWRQRIPRRLRREKFRRRSNRAVLPAAVLRQQAARARLLHGLCEEYLLHSALER